MDNLILTPTAPGELIDKITVLRIKKERIADPVKLANIEKELNMLEETRAKFFPTDSESFNKISELEESLKRSNEEIWDMGDAIRKFGDKGDFGPDFVKVAYGIHLSNDRRAALKKEINLLLNSPIIEEKSYKDAK